MAAAEKTADVAGAVPVVVEGLNEEFLSLAEIAASPDVEYAAVEAWNGKKLRIASVTADDIIEWSSSNDGDEAVKRTAGLRLIIKSAVDKDGKRFMNKEHITMLRSKSHKITERIVKAILDLNGMNVKADNAAKND